MNVRIFYAFLFLLCVSSSVHAQKPGVGLPPGEAGKDYNVRNAKGKKHGTWIRVYEKNPAVLYYRGQFENGVPVGVFDFYTETGELRSKVDHVQDSTINDVTFYHPDGITVMSTGRYTGRVEDGVWVRKKQGKWKNYDQSGVLRSEENYLDNELDGSCRYFYSNGKSVAEYQFRRGVKNGPFTTYYDSGKKEKEGAFLNDEYDGEYAGWRENGAQESKGKYVKGLKEGTWHYFNASGAPEVSILYKLGAETKRKYENGTFTEYYENGIPRSEYSYEDGMKNGPFREWYDRGQFVQVPGTSEEMAEGIAYREKLEGTQVRIEGDYLNDKLEGEITYYLENGRIDRIEVWSDGVLQSTRSGSK